MNYTPLVSVVVPAYNCVKYISETLISLFEQDYPNIEIIVVNDGSKDNTLEFLKTYGDRIVLIDQSNTGVPGARNSGIRAARGEFISFCDSDDLWAPQKVSDQVAYLKQHPSVGMVYCDWHVWNTDNKGCFIVPNDFKSPKNGQEIDPVKSGWIYHKLLLDCICLTSTVLFRKEIIDKVGFFDTDLWSGEDYNYWLRTSRITEIHKLRSQLVLYRNLPDGLSRTPTQIHYELEVLQNAIAQWGTTSPNGVENDAKEIKERVANMRFGFGYLHLKSGDPVIAAKSFWGAIIEKPLWHAPWIYLILSLWMRFVKIPAYSSKVNINKSIH